MIEHSKNTITWLLETMLDLECFSKKHSSHKSNKQIRNTLSGVTFVLLPCLQRVYLLNAGLEYSRSDLIFEQLKRCNNSIFGFLYLLVLPDNLRHFHKPISAPLD